VVREEGLAALWKGNVAATYLWITYSMVQFAVYGTFKRWGDEALGSMQDTRVGMAQSRNTALPDPSSRGSIDKSGRGRGYGESETPSSPGVTGVCKTMVLFLAGASAGVVATATTYPFDIMRTQFAIQGNERVHSSIAGFVGSTLKKEGFRGFYVGLPVGLIGVAPYIGLNFALYDSMKACAPALYRRVGVDVDDLQQRKMGWKVVIDGAMGGIAGGISKLVVHPLDTVKRRMQFSTLQTTVGGSVRSSPLHYDGMRHCAETIYKNEGVSGFFKGIVPTTVKAVTATAVTFAAFEGAKDFLAWRRRLNDDHGHHHGTHGDHHDGLERARK
jgi:solute carrier family 25 thiamine pyrophosphate transporter 19